MITESGRAANALSGKRLELAGQRPGHVFPGRIPGFFQLGLDTGLSSGLGWCSADQYSTSTRRSGAIGETSCGAIGETDPWGQPWAEFLRSPVIGGRGAVAVSPDHS